MLTCAFRCVLVKSRHDLCKFAQKLGLFLVAPAQRPQDFVLFAVNFILDVKMVVLRIWMVIWMKSADFDVEKVYF